jgi:hypothetical protein
VFIGVAIYTSAGFSSAGIQADHIYAKMTEASSSTVWHISINDGGPGTYNGHLPTGSAPTSALDGMTAIDSNGEQLSIPHFAAVTFGPAKLDQMYPAAAGAVGVDMETSGGVQQIKTSALNLPVSSGLRPSSTPETGPVWWIPS